MFDTSSSKISKQFWSLFNNRWAAGCFVLLTLQQLIESSSMLWLVEMMRRLTQGQDFLFYLYLYLISLLVAYLPGCLANIIKISWKQEAQRLFIQTFISSNRNQIGEWSNKNLKEEKLSILTTEGPNTLHALIDYVYDLYSYVCSVLLAIFVLSIVVEPLFGIAYSLSVLTVIFVMKMKRRTQRRLTQKALKARLDIYQSLLAAWDNVLLGNFYNFSIWEDKTKQRVNRCLKKNVELERFDQVLAILTSLMTSIPSLLVVVYYVYTNRYNVELLASFLVTIPILFTILSYTYQTLSLIFRWTMHSSKLIAIYKAIQPIKDCQLSMEKKVKWPKININFNAIVSNSIITSPSQMSLPGPLTINSYHELLEQAKNSGRLTLRGENGAGKSTLLMLIKNSLTDRAFFLPTQNQLSFLSETNKHSTGESLKNRLVEILEKVDVDVLLLDEWDANLDKENQECLSLLIDELAERKCVIEVRHR